MNSRIASLENTPEPQVRSRHKHAIPGLHDCDHSDYPTGEHIAGKLATQRLLHSGELQPKLTISEPGDVDEQEADLIADEVVSGTSGAVAQHDCGRSPSNSPSLEKAEKSPQTKAVPDQSRNATPTVQNQTPSQLGGGQPLAEPEKTLFESRLGHDLSQMRLYTDAKAAESARAINAVAYTVGKDVVFGAGQFAPGTHEGRRLLVHELTHVVRQTGESRVIHRYASCRHLLDPPEGTPVVEKSVQNDLATEARRLGNVEQELDVPAGSAAPFRTEPAPGRSEEVIEPQILSEVFDISGRADTALLNDSTLELVEVKEATWPSAVFAQTQLLNYVRKGNRAIGEMERIWHARGHPRDKVTSVRGMPTDRLSLKPATRVIDGLSVSLAWCRNGVIVFKAAGEENREILICGVRDRGSTDAFLNRMLGPAQAVAEQFVSQQIETPVITTLERSSLHDITQLLQRAGGIAASPASSAGEGKLEALIQKYEPQIRSALLAVAHQGLEAVRQKIQADLRLILEESAMILCSTAAIVTAAPLLKEYGFRLARHVLDPHYIFVPLIIAPAFMPEEEPVPAKESSSFRKRVSEITGLSGTALTVYLIISEGSRIFPLRNLIPAP